MDPLFLLLFIGLAIVIVVVVLAVGASGARKNKEEFLSASNYTSSLRSDVTDDRAHVVIDQVDQSGVSPEVHAQISALVGAEQPIKAIKLLREKTSLSLVDAKQIIDHWDAVPVPTDGNTTSLKRSATSAQFTDSDIDRISQLITSGRKIEAIKEVRLVSGWGLKEAKDLVDQWSAQGRPPGHNS